MSGYIDSVIPKSGLVENVAVEVEIASLYQAVQKLLPLPFLRPPSWISGRRIRRFFSGMAPLKSPYPKMGGRHRICVSSCSVGKARGVQSRTSPSNFAHRPARDTNPVSTPHFRVRDFQRCHPRENPTSPSTGNPRWRLLKRKRQ